MTEWQDLALDEDGVPDSGIANAGREQGAELNPADAAGLKIDREPVSEPEASETVEAEIGCQTRMGKTICGRPVYLAREGIDDRQVCLMHSKDTNKLSGLLFESFWSEFERILEAAGDQAAYFDRFVFPTLNFNGREFSAYCSFNEATFSRDADFRQATFVRSADFTKANFTKNTNFGGALFKQRVKFNRAVFAQHASFPGATFTLIARFTNAEFRQSANFRGVSFLRTAKFTDAKFIQKSNFSNARFVVDASFRRAVFTQNAGFSSAIFERNADFDHAEFLEHGSFFSTRFTESAKFGSVSFASDADFRGATFAWGADFSRATFLQNTTFLSASFTRKADFSDATFSLNASFSKAHFAQSADFSRAIFSATATFIKATFSQNAEFSDATFTGLAGFQLATFLETAHWQRSRFLDRAEFRSTKFEPRSEGVPSSVFALARFSKPQEIIFDDVDLGRVLFHNCDVSEVWFTSSAHWATRKRNQGLTVFEEIISLESRYGTELQRDGRRDFRAVAQVCQQLKKNYDSRLDYWTANEFHFGEMEMKRLDPPRTARFPKIREWLHPRLSLVAFYRVASDYGNSSWKPAKLLTVVLLTFTMLLPIPGVGLKRQNSRLPETYNSVWNTSDHWTPNLVREERLVAKAAIAAVDGVTFQRNAEYLPAYPWGRVLAILCTLVTSSLFALFLLAVRRQFKR